MPVILSIRENVIHRKSEMVPVVSCFPRFCYYVNRNIQLQSTTVKHVHNNTCE